MNFFPKEKHCSVPGIVNSGLISQLTDCHCNWTAAIAIMKHNKLTKPKPTFTSTQKIQFF